MIKNVILVKLNVNIAWINRWLGKTQRNIINWKRRFSQSLKYGITDAD